MFTRNSLPTDGSRGPFPIGFNYLSGDTITVTRTDNDGVTNQIPLAFTFHGSKSDSQPSGGSIRLVDPQPSGKLLVIAKVIDMDTPAVVWTAGTELSQRNLRASVTDLMEKGQAAYDLADEAYTRNKDVLDNIQSVLPENVLQAAEDIQLDRVLAQEAATEAQAASALIATRLITEIELDFGAVPTRSKLFTVEVIGVPVGPVRVDQTYKAAPGRSVDENAMDTITCTAYAATANTLTINAVSLQGPVAGKYNFVLTF